MKPLAPNVLIQDRYLIVHLIGKGGMGEVYLAVDQRLGSAVALKRTFFSDDEMLATAFEREARILANLRHPILPKVSDHFIEGENQFLVMEHITGDDLSKRLEKTQQAFPLSWVLFWADQLLDALHYLHTHEPPIIHRDIKPQNLKLTNDNHIVLLDFGLSKNSVGETRTSSTGSIVGYTPHYAPMEQIRGTGTNAQSDLYSLSATVYQLLTNTVPPDALTRADSLLSGLPDPIRSINELNKEVSEEVSEVILKGMDIRQDSRFGSAREMQKSLRDAYAKLQSAMSAQTIAFTVNEKDIAAVDSLPSEELPVAETSPRATTGDFEYGSPAQESSSAGNSNEKINDAQYDTGGNGAVNQSDLKTEVLLAGDSPAITAAQEGSEIPSDPVSVSEPELDEPVEDFSTAGDFSVDDSDSNAGAADQSAMQATIPIMDYQQSEPAAEEPNFESEAFTGDAFEGVGGHGDTEFFSSIELEDGPAAGATFANNQEEFKEEVAQAPVEALKVAPAAKKSSAGKKIALVLGLFAVLVLVVGGVGGAAWFMMRGGMGGDATPLPTPEATIEATPSEEPTPEETPADDNSNIDLGETNSNTSDVGPIPSSTPNITTQPTARPTVTTTVKPTAKPPTTPRPTQKPPATPRTTPGGILQ